MIAPPHYKCETTTLDKAKAMNKIEQSLKIIEKVIKEKGGLYKLLNKPVIIGHRDDKDIDDLMNKYHDEKEEAGSSEEDNEEGIDIDLEGDEEEKKEESKSKKKAKKNKGSDSEEDDDDDV
jgi:hypothetical protein